MGRITSLIFTVVAAIRSLAHRRAVQDLHLVFPTRRAPTLARSTVPVRQLGEIKLWN